MSSTRPFVNVVARRLGITFCLVASLVATGGSAPASDTDESAIRTRAQIPPTLVAELTPPSTFYEVVWPDDRNPAGNYDYRWHETDVGCGVFSPRELAGLDPWEAQWYHPESDDPDEGCPHDSPSHPGTIRVIVFEGLDPAWRCVYQGSLDGESPCRALGAAKVALTFPQEGAVIDGGTFVTAEPAPAIRDKVRSVGFSFAPEGGKFAPIIGTTPDLVGQFAALWNTKDVAGGTYLLKTKVRYRTKDGLKVATDQTTVRVNEPPVAFATADQVRRSGDETVVRFDAQGSFDNDGSIVSYRWDFGDGTTGTGRLIEHRYMNPGNYPVSLVVTDNEGAESTGHLILEISNDRNASNVDLVNKTACGCRSMEIKVTGQVEGPEGFVAGPEDVTHLPESEQANLGPYNDGAAGNQLDMTKNSFVVKCRFQVIAELADASAPDLCAEGQSVKRTAHSGGKDFPKVGPRTSDPRYDPSVGDPDDPYNANDNPNQTEKGLCGFTGRAFCDDDYHGGNGADGTGSDGLQPPNPMKLHEEQSRILWLDGPGFFNLRKSELRPDGASYRARFKATVGGSLGTCTCTWRVVIRISATGQILENELSDVRCTTS